MFFRVFCQVRRLWLIRLRSNFCRIMDVAKITLTEFGENDMFKNMILEAKHGIVTYGITPPKKNNSDEKIKEITQRHVERLRSIDIDALIVYDIQEEAERASTERPFPFLPTIDSEIYSRDYLCELKIPQIVYRCVGKYTEKQMKEWILSSTGQDRYSVFVGAASSQQKVTMRLNDAYDLYNSIDNNILLGGVVIPERHMMKQDEHIRIINKN